MCHIIFCFNAKNSGAEMKTKERDIGISTDQHPLRTQHGTTLLRE